MFSCLSTKIIFQSKKKKTTCWLSLCSEWYKHNGLNIYTNIHENTHTIDIFAKRIIFIRDLLYLAILQLGWRE